MSILMTILTIIAGLIALIFILALFTKKDYTINRSIVINRPVNSVFDYIRHIRNQDNYNKWVMTDPAMRKSFSGTDGQAGFIYAWDGNQKAGAGEQEIKSVTENRRLEIEIRFKRPFKAIACAPFTTEAVDGNQTRVNWEMSSRMNYPLNIMLMFMNVEKVLGRDLEASLQMLKGNLEESF